MDNSVDRFRSATTNNTSNGQILESNEPQSKTDVLVVDILGIVSRRWPLILFSIVLCVGLAMLYAFTTEVIYESTAEILVIQKDSSLPTQGNQGQLGFEPPNTAELLSTHMRIITSPRIVLNALEKNQLIDLPSIISHLDEDEDSVDYVIENLSVNRGGEGAAQDAHVLQIAFRHTSEEECATILNAIIDEYQTFLGDTVKGAGNEAADLISEAKDDLEAMLLEKESNYRKFRENAPILWNKGESQNVHQVRVMEWEAALSQLRLRRMAVESRLEIVRNSLKEENIDKYNDLERFALIDQADIARLTLLVDIEKGDPISEAFQSTVPYRAETASAEFNTLLTLKLEAKTQERELGPNHPDVETTREKIRQLEDFLRENESRVSEPSQDDTINLKGLFRAYLSLLENDLHGINRQITEFRTLISDEQEIAKSLVSIELEDQSHVNALSRARALYDTVFERLREINLLKDYGGFITNVISPVQLGEKAWPSIPILAVLGCLLGGFLGSALALTIDLADRSYRNLDDVKTHLQLPILAQVPHIKLAKKDIIESADIDSSIAAFHKPKSLEAENIRSLRTSLYFHTAGKSGNVIQITSPLPGDGKTTVTSNLAVSLAQTDKRVIVVDADMRRPRLHQCFGMKSENGLSDVLISRLTIEDAVKHSEVDGLDILTSGTVPPNPSELLSMPGFGKLVEKLREHYDFVLLDCPPVLSVIDPIIAASHADGTVLVLKIQPNSRETSTKAKNSLKDAGAHLLGLTVNDSRLQQNRKATYGYGYGYGYGSKGRDKKAIAYYEA